MAYPEESTDKLGDLYEGKVIERIDEETNEIVIRFTDGTALTVRATGSGWARLEVEFAKTFRKEL